MDTVRSASNPFDGLLAIGFAIRKRREIVTLRYVRLGTGAGCGYDSHVSVVWQVCALSE